MIKFQSKNFRKLIVVSALVFTTIAVNAQLQKFKVEIPTAPKFKINDSIQSVTILNRSISNEFENYLSDSLQVHYYRLNFDTDKVLLDSTASDTSIQVLGEILFESQRFDIVIPVNRNIPRYLPYQNDPEPLTWSYVENICEQYNTDALIVLENFAVRAVTNYQRRNDYHNDRFLRMHYAEMEFYFRSHWRMYEPKSKNILVDVIDQDTLFWDGYEMDVNMLFAKIPAVKSALIETGIASAIDFSEFIAPKWDLQTRYYYQLKDNSIDVAINYASEGNWEEALSLWLDFTEIGSKAQRSKVMLNVSLAYEMLGDLKQAIHWAKKSNRTYYREVVNHYYKQLLTRKNK